MKTKAIGTQTKHLTKIERKTKMKKKLLILLAVTAILVTLAVAFTLGATDDSALSIGAYNLSFRDNVCIKYAVKSPSDDVKLLIWTTPKSSADEYIYGTQDEILTPVGYDTEVDGLGTRYIIFDYTKLTAKQMTDYVYARAYIDGETPSYSSVVKYSILEYAYNMLGKTDTAIDDEDFKTMLIKMLEYGASAQTHFEYKADRLATADFYEVRLTDGWLDDGCKHGLYKVGSSVVITAPESDAEKMPFEKWVDSEGNTVAVEVSTTLTVGNVNEVYTAVYTKYSEGLEFVSNGDGTCYVSGTGSCTDTDVIIPSTHNGETVTGIGNNAFIDCGRHTSITIPDSVTSIGDWAFSDCTSLTSITIPDGVTSIGEDAFHGCCSLASVIFGENSQLTSIGIHAFYNCDSLTSITIPDGVTSIGEYAFAKSLSFTSITFGDNSQLTSIGEYAFEDCPNLTSITIPDSVTSIGSYAFLRCRSLTSITIPDSVMSIGEEAFCWCDSLRSVTFGENNSQLTSIGIRAFYCCSSLTDIYFTGTEGQWNAIEKGSDWEPTYDYIVHCNYAG